MGKHVQVGFANFTTKGEDVVVNTWNVNAPTPTDWVEADYIALRQAFIDFYDVMPAGQPAALAKYISGTIPRTQSIHTFKVWDMTQDQIDGLDPLGAPEYSAVFSLATAPVVATNMPNETSLVLSLEAVGHDEAPVEVGATRPRSRFKGRVYLPPMTTGAIGTAVSGNEARPATDLISITLAALAELRDDVIAIDAAARLGVWSRSDGALRALSAASIDNSFDVVRSRSIGATSRTRVLL